MLAVFCYSEFFIGLAAGSRVTAWVFMIGSGMWFVRRMSLKKLFLAGLFSLAVIWATYFFRSDVIIAERPDPSRLSSKLERFEALRSLIFNLKTQPIPLGNYLATIKNNIVRAGHLPRTLHLPVNFFLKTPLLMLIALSFFFLRIIRDKTLLRQTMIIWVPMGAIFSITSLSGQQPWVRYLLPMYPFFVIPAALAIFRFPKTVIILFLLWLSLGTLVQYPHFISYANELAGLREKRFEKFTDSNIDWGQSLPDLASYVEKRKPTLLLLSYFGRDDAGLYGLPSAVLYGSYKFNDICSFHPVQYHPSHGPTLIAISISNWHGCGYSKLDRFAKNRIRAVVGDAILMFDQK